MSYAELIEQLQGLPEAKQVEVFDFVAFLANRNPVGLANEKTLTDSLLAELIRHPINVDEFTPLSREEANDR
ncbi:MAG: DUF2281 domain-containing protein [Methylococcales bacterium]